MKRFGNLYPTICSWENLELAAKKVRKRKRYRHYAENFELRRESILRELREKLVDHRWQPGAYRTFRIYDPKERVICAPPYRDRVVHHALCNVIAPILERSMIEQSYSCRINKGTGAARKKCLSHVRKYRYVLKLDVQKYFPSIDHLCLKDKIRHHIKCGETLKLIDRIINSWHDKDENLMWFKDDDLFTHVERPRGLPIGSLTSQLFANLYLSRIDHVVQEQIKPKGYLRYTDDLAVFSNSKAFLHDALHVMSQEFMSERLKPHAKKCRIFRCGEGVPFLGFRFYPDRVRVLRANRIRFEKRMNRLRNKVKKGEIAVSDVWPSMFGWFQFVREYPVNEGLVIAECRSLVFQ